MQTVLQIHERLRLQKHKIAARDRGYGTFLVFERDEQVRISPLLLLKVRYRDVYPVGLEIAPELAFAAVFDTYDTLGLEDTTVTDTAGISFRQALDEHLAAEADLYGQHVAVDFVSRIRGMEKFDRVEELVAEMKRDADKARGILAAQ